LRSERSKGIVPYDVSSIAREKRHKHGGVHVLGFKLDRTIAARNGRAAGVKAEDLVVVIAVHHLPTAALVVGVEVAFGMGPASIARTGA
jgi:hypothetical protein